MTEQHIGFYSKTKIGQLKRVKRTHSWVTVVNPINHTHVLQACDHCGVVKSENSIVRACSGEQTSRLLTQHYASHFSQAV